MDSDATEPTSAPSSLTEAVEPAPSAAAQSSSDADPHGIERALEAATARGAGRGTAALTALSFVLVEDEIVESLVIGRYLGHSAVLALTTTRAVVVNDRHWQPDGETIALTPDLDVKGWIITGEATIRLRSPHAEVVVDQISGIDHARSFAQAIRNSTQT